VNDLYDINILDEIYNLSKSGTKHIG